MKVISITEVFKDCPRFLSFEQEQEILRDALIDHDAYYYGKPAEMFNEQEAIAEAKAAGKSAVILDNLS